MNKPTREEAERELNELLAKIEGSEQIPVPEKTEEAVDKAINALESEKYEESLEISKKLKEALEAEGERAKDLIYDILGEERSKGLKSRIPSRIPIPGVDIHILALAIFIFYTVVSLLFWGIGIFFLIVLVIGGAIIFKVWQRITGYEITEKTADSLHNSVVFIHVFLFYFVLINFIAPIWWSLGKFIEYQTMQILIYAVFLTLGLFLSYGLIRGAFSFARTAIGHVFGKMGGGGKATNAVVVGVLALLALSAVAPVLASSSSGSSENIDVTLTGKAYSPSWDNYLDAEMHIVGGENRIKNNYFSENAVISINVPEKGKSWEFEASGFRNEYHISLQSRATENFGLIPPYVNFGYATWSKEFHPRIGKYARMGGADFSGWTIENYWWFTGTIVEQDNDGIFETYDTTSFILENAGGFGPAPTADTYKGFIKKMIYWRQNIVSEVYNQLGLEFWHNRSVILHNKEDIVEGIREIIDEYIP